MTIDTLPDDNSRWDDSSTPSLNTIFKVFSEPVRRESLVVLRREDEPISVTELANRLDRETDRTRIALVHSHLPMLDSAGIVDWDLVRESVGFGDFPNRYDQLFDVVERDVR